MSRTKKPKPDHIPWPRTKGTKSAYVSLTFFGLAGGLMLTGLIQIWEFLAPLPSLLFLLSFCALGLGFCLYTVHRVVKGENASVAVADARDDAVRAYMDHTRTPEEFAVYVMERFSYALRDFPFIPKPLNRIVLQPPKRAPSTPPTAPEANSGEEVPFPE